MLAVHLFHTHDARDAPLFRRIDKNMRHSRTVLEHIVRAPAHDYARTFRGNFGDGVKLGQKHPLVQRHLQAHAARTHMQARARAARQHAADGVFFVVTLQKLVTKTAFFRRTGQDFFIIEGNTQFIG